MLFSWSLYFSRNSPALENAIWLIYLSTSSSVIPIPRSVMVSVFSLSSTATRIVKSPNSPLNSPLDATAFIFCVASTAFATSSLKKISWSEYKNFLITGKMFSVVTPMCPFAISVNFKFLIV